jgi:hypothetical protein
MTATRAAAYLAENTNFLRKRKRHRIHHADIGSDIDQHLERSSVGAPTAALPSPSVTLLPGVE